jgi:hypothetical protein
MRRLFITPLILVASLGAATTHDDPIIIDQGSVIITFGLHTRAILQQQWNSPMNLPIDGSRYVYYQHGHLQSTKPRVIHGLFREPNSSTPRTREHHRFDLASIDQTRLRIEVFLKGTPVAGGPERSLGANPQIILSAVNESVPCCMHPQGVDPGIVKENCPFDISHDGPKSSTGGGYAWSWRVSTEQPLHFKETLSAAKTLRGAPLQRMEYKDPNYKNVSVDRWETYLVDRATGRKGDSVASSTYVRVRGQRQTTKLSRPGDCAVIEMCAAERGANGKDIPCEKTESDCFRSTDPGKTGGKGQSQNN